MTAWRTTQKCNDCPFSEDGAGKELWDSLRSERREEILDGLRNDQTFFCHKTATGYDDEEVEDFLEAVATEKPLVCSGSIKWQEEHGYSANYVRVAERIEAFTGEQE